MNKVVRTIIGVTELAVPLYACGSAAVLVADTVYDVINDEKEHVLKNTSINEYFESAKHWNMFNFGVSYFAGMTVGVKLLSGVYNGLDKFNHKVGWVK